MKNRLVRQLWTAAAVAAGLAAGTATAADVVLHHITYPERREVDVDLKPTSRAPDARVTAEVEYREGQAAIKLKFRDMKPAILLGGDVTSYVLWAVERDGTYENLGELWVRKDDDTLTFATGKKAFALLVTAESYPLVPGPSELVMFSSGPPDGKGATSSEFTFSDFAPAAETRYQSLSAVAWRKDEGLDLRQAEKALDLAKEAGADEYAPELMQDAQIKLSQAQNLSVKSSLSTESLDYARRSLNLASEAMQITRRKKEAEELARQIEQRRAEMAQLEARATEAEEMAATASRQLEQARQAREAADTEKMAAEAAVAAATTELARLERERTSLQQTVGELDARAARLRDEKEQLSERLSGALAEVAETRESARGMILNLPDILFEVDKADLKPELRVVLAKLAGILLIMPELNLRIEGHTDATGGEQYNQQLSEKRAASARDFLAQQGVDMNRMVAVGYGESRPVADNESREGRAKNRRVEIVIGEGTVEEAVAPGM
jgi:outer membrane protein OmpA-like peptidoglycan-associated protein